MAVSEPDRHELYQALEQKIGKRPTEIFMNLVTTVPWAQVATKTDLGAFRDALRAEMATKDQVERMGRKITMWTSSMVVAMTGVAFAAGRLV